MRKYSLNPGPWVLTFSAISVFAINTASSQVPGAVYSACTTANNPLDPNNDGFITSTGTSFTPTVLEESEEFEGTGWNVVWHKDPEPTSDLQTGGTCGATEIVDNPNTNEHAAFFKIVDPDTDPTNRNEQLVIRMRIATNPVGAYGYSLLIDTDQKFGTSTPA